MRRNLGAEVFERLIEPFCSGTSRLIYLCHFLLLPSKHFLFFSILFRRAIINFGSWA